MKILQLSPQFPFPLSDGGKISIANMTRALVSSSCEVHLFCLVHTMPNEQQIQSFEQYSGAKCSCILHNTRNTPLAILRSLFDAEVPLYIRKHRSVELRHAIELSLLKESYDAILCDHTAMAEIGLFASELADIPCIVRMHNIEHVIWERYADRLSIFDPRKWFTQSQAKKLRKKEINLCSKVNHLAMITEFDVEKISSLHPAISASYIPVGVDTEVFKPICATKSIHGLIHATTYDWVHNVEALDWFIADILPEIQKRFSTELVLLGKNMPIHFRNGKIPGLIGKGYVEDINVELNKAYIYIAPLFVGGGIRIKILEAMSAGLPIIASPVSAEGIMAKREDGLFICSTKEDWILEISNLMENPLLTKQLGENARAFIEKNHSWECTANRMKLLIQELNA
ncbi:MAG: hypothetical protein RL734_812 [Bacteroidota bacterium]|jgi:glycosyltransferase involved in cell wall biosynthesis